MSAASSSNGPLAGKVAIVTGASRGIGAAIAHRLVDDGAKVVVNYSRSKDEAQAVVNALDEKVEAQASEPVAVAIQADVSSVAASKSLFEESVKAFGQVDLLVLNAGMMGNKTLPDVDEAFYDDHFNVNVKGPLFLVQAAQESLRPGACIVA